MSATPSHDATGDDSAHSLHRLVMPPTKFKHHCHAKGCNVPVPPKMLMCLRHWRMVPCEIQRRVWAHYRPGQEIDKQPTAKYLEVMTEAIEAVAAQEI